MIVAGVVIETMPGAASGVRARLDGISGLELHDDDGVGRVAATWRGRNDDSVESLAERLSAWDPEILAVSLAYVGTAPD